MLKRIPKPLQLSAPITRWDEALPLGNGLIGVLVWGEGRTVRLSLDRGDLWDLRQPPELKSADYSAKNLARWIVQGNHRAIQVAFEGTPPGAPYPTKLPAGRMELKIKRGQVKSFALDFRSGCGTVRFDNGGTLEICLPPDSWGLLLRAKGVEFSIRLVPPKRSDGSQGSNDMGCPTIDKLGYPPPKRGPGWLLQQTADNAHAIFVQRRGEEAAVALARDPGNALSLAETEAARLLDRQFAGAVAASRAWWQDHWSASSVEVPDPVVQYAYDFAQYTYGACSRPGHPPMPLQGLWTADDGTLPPWRGDYHNDLNVQLSYWAALPANRQGCDRAMLDFYWELLPTHRHLARRIWNAPGAWVPGIMTLDGQPILNWVQYAMTSTAGAWIAWHFHRHWKFTGDKTFLQERALPYCKAMGDFLVGLLKPSKDGQLRLPFSASPEIHNNSPQAWLRPNSNYDLALMRWLFGALVEMEPKNQVWRETLRRLPPLAVSRQEWQDWAPRPGSGPLQLSPDEELAESHRHHSHLIAIHPLGLLRQEQPDDAQVIDQSLLQLERLGTGFWCGYSFGWAACLAARSGKATVARHYLQAFSKVFCSRNGFHLNGDFKHTGTTSWHHRPFTLEGNFAAAEAVHEMLLQSHGGTLRLFPATPTEWSDVGFENLRAEGGWLVSARRREGRLAWVRITAPTSGGPLRVRKPESPLHWDRPVRRLGGQLVIQMPPGSTVTASGI